MPSMHMKENFFDNGQKTDKIQFVLQNVCINATSFKLSIQDTLLMSREKKILSKIYVRLNLFYVQARAYDSGKALGKKFALEFVKLYKNQLL